MGLLTNLYLGKRMTFKASGREVSKTRKFIYNHGEPKSQLRNFKSLFLILSQIIKNSFGR